MTSQTRYSTVFNRLCHLAALSKEGKTKAAIDSILMTTFAINRTDPVSTASDVAHQIEGYFGLAFDPKTLQSTISTGALLRYSLFPSFARSVAIIRRHSQKCFRT